MMKKRIFCLLLVGVMMLSGCCLSHELQEATCETPKTCAKCEKTEGEALGHSWQDATCLTPKTCATCGKTEGEALGHQIFWNRVDDENMEGTCENCQEQFQEAMDWEKLAPYYLQGRWDAYGAPEGSYLQVNGDGTAEFNNGEKAIAMTWEFVRVNDTILGTSVLYQCSSDELTFEIATVTMLGDTIMFPMDGDIWSMSKAQN